MFEIVDMVDVMGCAIVILATFDFWVMAYPLVNQYPCIRVTLPIRPLPETRAIARARVNPAQNEFARAFFRLRSLSKQRCHLIAQLSFPMFELLTIKYHGVSK